MPVAEIAEAAPRNRTHPACAKPATRSLPAWACSVNDFPGEVAVAQINPVRLPDLVDHLNESRIGYYWPFERVRKRFDKGWKVYSRSIFPGTLFIEVGKDREHKSTADEFCSFVGWRLGWVFANKHPESQRRFRRELSSLEKLLGADPELSVMRHISPGQRVRVISGAFMGVEGEVIAGGPQATLQVSLRTMNRAVLVTIAREMLEPI